MRNYLISFAACSVLAAATPAVASAAHPRRSSHQPSAHAAVVGGVPATAGAWPSLAFVADSISQNEAELCSGTVVAPELVLTAGHCGEEISTGALDDPANFRVITGALDWTDQTTRQVLDVSRVIVYPSFSRLTLSGDLALLELSTPTSAPPMQLATQADTGLLQAGLPATVAGWGLESGSQANPPTTAQQGPTVLQSRGYCEVDTVVDAMPFDPKTQLCAIDAPSETAAACKGDSGGPLVATVAGAPVEIGVTSSGGPTCAPNVPNIYTSVSYFSPWIQSWIKYVSPTSASAASAGQPGATPAAPSAPAPASAASRPPSMPTMTRPEAKTFLRLILRGLYKRSFTHRSAYAATCQRRTPEQMACGVHWSSGGVGFRGNVSVFFKLDGVALDFGFKAAIDRCALRAGRATSCTLRRVTQSAPVG